MRRRAGIAMKPVMLGMIVMLGALALPAATADAARKARPAQLAKSAETPGERPVVSFPNDYGHGAIVVKTSERHLYYTISEREAIRYPIAVGKPSEQWFGESYVSAKAKNPGWSPTASMRRNNPRLPRYVPPGPQNPLGARALYLAWTTYRIHGTNAPNSIGGAASAGCFRMLNADVSDLYERVHIGAPVFVIQ